MADEEKNLIDNPASEETPPEPKVEDTEEQWETVAGPGGKDDQKPQEQKVDEQKPEDEKGTTFWRNEYQQLLTDAKTDSPRFTQDWLAKRKQERKQETATAVEDVAQGKISDTGDDQEFATKADINRILGEVRSEIGKEREQAKQERDQEQFYNEYDKTNAALVAFRQKHNISNEEHDKISAEAASFGADLETLGGPSAFIRAYGKVATDYLQNRQGNQQQQAVTSEAEQKALAAKMAMQPSGSAIDMQAKRKLTDQEKLLDQMHAEGANAAAEEIFGK